jgi:hypothetical protein
MPACQRDIENAMVHEQDNVHDHDYAHDHERLRE